MKYIWSSSIKGISLFVFMKYFWCYVVKIYRVSFKADISFRFNKKKIVVVAVCECTNFEILGDFLSPLSCRWPESKQHWLDLLQMWTIKIWHQTLYVLPLKLYMHPVWNEYWHSSIILRLKLTYLCFMYCKNAPKKCVEYYVFKRGIYADFL